MSVARGRWADPEVLLVVKVLQTLAGGEEHADSETPEDLIDRLPFIRARKIDGDRDAIYDRPVLEVDAFGPSRSVAQPLADDAFDLIMSRPPPHPTIDAAYCSVAPRQLPWGDGRIRRWSATYALVLRRTRVVVL